VSSDVRKSTAARRESQPSVATLAHTSMLPILPNRRLSSDSDMRGGRFSTSTVRAPELAALDDEDEPSVRRKSPVGGGDRDRSVNAGSVEGLHSSIGAQLGGNRMKMKWRSAQDNSFAGFIFRRPHVDLTPYTVPPHSCVWNPAGISHFLLSRSRLPYLSCHSASCGHRDCHSDCRADHACHTRENVILDAMRQQLTSAAKQTPRTQIPKLSLP
jgi:hypothetical protein